MEGEKDESRVAGGLARAQALSAVERSDIARKAAEARWELPKELRDGVLRLADMEFPCAVLEDGTRVLTEMQFMNSLGIYRSGALSTRRRTDSSGAQVPLSLAFKNLKPFISRHLGDVHLQIQKYRTRAGNVAHGIRAETIPKICEVWMDASAAGVLGARQEQIAAKAALIMRGLAHVGIIALVDEATGYQDVRDRQALQAILDQYLRKELAAWAKKFPEGFYREIFRLRGWAWRGMSINRPQCVAQYTKDLVYARMLPGLVKELERRAPRDSQGNRKGKLHQLFTDDVGDPALAQHLYAVVGLMRASKDWDSFMRLVNRAFPRQGETLSLPFMDD